MTAVELIGVTKEYESGDRRVTALDDINVTVDEGEFVSVIGPSGSGKSTMLNLIGLLDRPTSGRVVVGGVDATDMSESRRTEKRGEVIGFVFQDFYLLPNLTAEENVRMPTAFNKSRVDSGRARELLGRVGLGDRVDHYPNELSGGQKQRVAIARSLINSPEVLLTDEPTGNLDLDTSERILGEISKVRETGVSVIAVTHDPMVEEYADRTVELVDGRLSDSRSDTARVGGEP
ncbi:ABC transporter ATP-binding protein [Haladaptatus sp. F3-133]|jgi:putative ABC transport system ATP-binding protein|uniref:ABC transporter ATP-binding protein n=1 Tax=Halorutilus salinus TaxID=2487751 RepID=A0A9Q4C2Q3_9EURY|nr:ABC transporter ATP-binding protein [Halorutilus salinus]MCX2817874.1 ABC transporter ATP-binding protein [Halorutilus salinus]